MKKWVEERDGEPGVVEGVVDRENEGEMLRIHFPGHSKENLDNTFWEQFLEIFVESNLELLFQEKTTEGEGSKL